MALALHEARRVHLERMGGRRLAAQIKRAQAAGDPDTGETYYRHWLATLEHAGRRTRASPAPETLHRYRDAWDHAADRTPHGSADRTDAGETYYRHWLATLETLVAAKGVTTSDALHRYRDAWDHAADRTPHGAPIELTPGDFG